MREYGRVYTQFWSSHTIRSMSEDGRTLALYLMTGPHTTITGTFRLPDGYACEDLQWTSERVSEGFAELFRKGFANRCETTKWVWICKHLDWNPPENPNQRKAAAKLGQSIPDDCAWKADFLGVFGETLGLKEPEKANPSETLPEPFRNQDQDQDQEQDGKRSAPARTPQPTGQRLPDDFTLTPERRRVADTERVNAERSFARFCDHWRAASGSNARKRDWDAAWRNWCRKDADMRRPAGPVAEPSPLNPHAHLDMR